MLSKKGCDSATTRLLAADRYGVETNGRRSRSASWAPGDCVRLPIRCRSGAGEIASSTPLASITNVELKAMLWLRTRSVSASRATASSSWRPCTPALNDSCCWALPMKVSVMVASLVAYTRLASRAWSISSWRCTR
ncbi:hypothetical protein D3C80_1351900 [compost metagenome]